MILKLRLSLLGVLWQRSSKNCDEVETDSERSGLCHLRRRADFSAALARTRAPARGSGKREAGAWNRKVTDQIFGKQVDGVRAMLCNRRRDFRLGPAAVLDASRSVTVIDA